MNKIDETQTLPEYYPDFDLTNTVAQDYLLDLTRQLYYNGVDPSAFVPDCGTDGAPGCPCMGDLNSDPTTRCEEFAMGCGPRSGLCGWGYDTTLAGKYANVMLDFYNYVAAANTSWPLSASNFTEKMYEFVLTRTNYRAYIGFTSSAPPGKTCTSCDITWVAMNMKSYVPNGLSSYATRPYYNSLSGWLDKLNENSPQSLGPAVMYNSFWIVMATEIDAVSGILIGFVISILVVFISLLIFVGNIVVALWSILTLIAAMSIVMSMFVIIGWGLGIIEALSATILVGLGDFYVFHIAEAYVETPATDSRNTRLRQALTRVGFSILSGSVTVFIASGSLLLCQLQIFVKFGGIIAMNTAITIYFSLFLLSSLLSLWGPTGNAGDLPLLKKVRHLGKYDTSGKTRIDPSVFEGSKASD